MGTLPLHFTEEDFEAEMELGELQSQGSPFPLDRYPLTLVFCEVGRGSGCLLLESLPWQLAAFLLLVTSTLPRWARMWSQPRSAWFSLA